MPNTENKFDIKDLKQTAHLARLDFNEDELQALQKDLHNILDMVNTIQHTDTSNIEPISHAFNNVSQPLREDLVTEPNVRDEIQDLAPQKMAGLYLVPQVIE